MEWIHGAERCRNLWGMELMPIVFSNVGLVAELVLGKSRDLTRVSNSNPLSEPVVQLQLPWSKNWSAITHLEC